MKISATHLPILTVLIGLLVWQPAQAESTSTARVSEGIIVCPDTGSNQQVADFTSAECDIKDLYSIDPTNQSFWVRLTLALNQEQLDTLIPLGLFIFGKAASYAYLNGYPLGQNGAPGTNKFTEVPGSMDAVLYMPQQQLTIGENYLDVRLSGHHGFLTLANPIHYMGVRPYANPTNAILIHYWKTLLPLGVLILGVIYFGILALQQKNPLSHLLLPAMTLFTIVQLVAEVSRGLFAYPYPFHDTRLMIILVCSLCFGLSLFAHALVTLKTNHKKTWLTLAVVITATLVITTPGFDNKSAFALGVPFAFTLAVAIYMLRKQSPDALGIATGVGLFIGTILLSPSVFLDIYYFYFVAALILFLFIQHSRAVARARKQQSLEKARADKLQFIVDRNRLDSDSPVLSIKSATKTELVSIVEIAYCKGAGDYVELVLDSGQSVLHSENLNDLEETLPSTFIRVHRSYIVNTTKIGSIERKPSGTGIIQLSNNATIPVSRRIMPSVSARLVSL